MFFYLYLQCRGIKGNGGKQEGCDYIKKIFLGLILVCLIIGLPSATAVTITKDTVTAYGWNSCSKGWYKTGGTFINYCPFCHRYGTLHYNPKGTVEGEWTCTCDADFCLCGRCKATGSQVYLKPYVKPEPKPIQETNIKPPTKWDYLKLKLNKPVLGVI